MYDEVFRKCFKNNKNTIVPWLLSASFAYYVLGETVISDEVFDKACKWFLEHYGDIKHKHKHLVTKEMLEAGSFYNISTLQYPLIVQNGTEGLINHRIFTGDRNV